MGGAINAAAPDATAFVHRRELFHVAYLSFWGTGDDAGVAAPPTLIAHDGPNPASVARNIGPRRPAAPAVASRARVSVPGAKLPPRRPVS